MAEVLLSEARRRRTNERRGTNGMRSGELSVVSAMAEVDATRAWRRDREEQVDPSEDEEDNEDE
jgi:hypothetical protein